jgi:cephalosporin hydroxylase
MTQREMIAAYAAGSVPPWSETRLFGKQLSKCPMDLWTYQEILWDTKPDLLIECGTGGGGSALFFAVIMDSIGLGEVFTVDIERYDHLRFNHPRITWIQGSSVGDGAENFIRPRAIGRRVMLVLDSDHRYYHVKAELAAYADLVAPGCYIVVEDTAFADGVEPWADQAVREFLAENPHFEADYSREKQKLTLNPGGWLRRVK